MVWACYKDGGGKDTKEISAVEATGKKPGLLKNTLCL